METKITSYTMKKQIRRKKQELIKNQEPIKKQEQITGLGLCS